MEKLVCKVIQTDENAILPTREHDDDIGWDVSVIKLIETKPGNIYIFDTGLQIEPPEGYYIELHGRSSLPLKGFRLANNVGIIDPNYRGNLKIMLQSIIDRPIAIAVPFKCCQLILKPIPPIVEWVPVDTLTETTRGAGGFGSTN